MASRQLEELKVDRRKLVWSSRAGLHHAPDVTIDLDTAEYLATDSEPLDDVLPLNSLEI